MCSPPWVVRNSKDLRPAAASASGAAVLALAKRALAALAFASGGAGGLVFSGSLADAFSLAGVFSLAAAPSGEGCFRVMRPVMSVSSILHSVTSPLAR